MSPCIWRLAVIGCYKLGTLNICLVYDFRNDRKTRWGRVTTAKVYRYVGATDEKYRPGDVFTNDLRTI